MSYFGLISCNMAKMSAAFLVLCCGAALGRSPGRIVGGDNAALGEFPYQASVQLQGPANIGHFCGAVILSENVVLTSGYCVIDAPAFHHVEVVAGMVNIHSEQTQGSRIARTIVHPNFKPDAPGPNDLAIHYLETAFTFDDSVQPIALPETDAIPSGVAVVTGWGSTSNTTTGNKAEDLQKVTLPLLTYEECLAAWGPDSPLTLTNLCAGPLDGGKGSCQNDLGGPFAQNGTLIGTVTWGHVPCGQPNFPSVFTRVSAHLDFIHVYLNFAKSMLH